ncbi:hypothetical protein FQN51_004774 [Onygenales sp. PD_10]|nr:hypothetical protein FQN51_004774 [Onygenales sp. PD_10]
MAIPHQAPGQVWIRPLSLLFLLQTDAGDLQHGFYARRFALYIDVDVKSYIVKYLTSPTPWLDPGSIIALATVDCQTANLAWDMFRDTLHYYFDSEDLILQLKLKCFHFQTWAKNSALTECKLPNGLLLIYETVETTLHLTSQLFENAGQLRGRYGLSVAMSDRAADEPDKISSLSQQ